MKQISLFLLTVLICLSCTKETIIQGQPGPQGIQGIQGVKGDAGEDGQDGQDGNNTVVSAVTIDPGTTCLNGGFEIFFGLDINKNGLLDQDEVEGSEIVCNGQNGTDGQDGTDGQNGSDGINCWDTNGNGVNDPSEDVNGDGEYNGLDCQGESGDTIVNLNGVWTTDEVLQGSPIQLTLSNSLFVPSGTNGRDTYYVDILYDNRLAEQVSFVATTSGIFRMDPVAVLIGTDRVIEGLEFENFGLVNERLYVLIRNPNPSSSNPLVVYFEGYLTRN
ncbi:DUF7151 family protein [Robiginitalea sp. IMCC43444]|uniref:DUF7151 family protein n=1 Tax=Robiginitalea sp. IMCC43444 TaxID=3459121 RepID=UPI004042D07F